MVQSPQDRETQLLLDALDDGVALFDARGIMVCCNRAYAALSGPLADIVVPGVAWQVLVHEAHARGLISTEVRTQLAWVEHLADLEPEERMVVPIPGPHGSMYEVTIRPASDGGFVVTERDVSHSYRIVQRETDADELIRSVLEACPTTILMIRASDGEIIYRTPTSVGLLGRVRKSQQFFHEARERADLLTDLLSRGRVDDMPFTGVRGDGATFPGSVSARLIEYRGEDVVVATVQDRSREISLRQAVADQRERVFQAEKLSALGELLAGVAHELNNPLSVVVGHSLMLRDEASDPEAIRRIEKISDAAERCTRIVRSFLAMARQRPARSDKVNLSEILHVAHEAALSGTGLFSAEVVVDLPADLPEVSGDEGQLVQVFLNLIANADQAMRGGGMGSEIRIRARPDLRERMVEVSVLDDGPGIPAEIRGRVFDPMFTTKEVGSGTGIGLAFCHRVVTAHGGSIRVGAGPQKGAEFILRLPMVGQADMEEAEAPSSPLSLSGARILIVDDEPEVAEVIREILVREGARVDSALSAKGALGMLRTGHYAAMLTDLNMPGMDGRQLLEAVRREIPQLLPRVGFITGDTMSPTARRMIEDSGRPYIEKPVSPRDVRNLVERLVAAGIGGEDGR